ncbi:MAG: MFS transporter [Chthoniobacteraceae bacterium]
MNKPNISLSKAEAAGDRVPQTYRIGTLTYTKLGLLTLLGCLLWGDFVFNFMEIVIGSFLPIKIKAMNAPDWYIATILITIPSALGMLTGPFYGVASDRTRTRWGRRRPYLLITTPLVTILLILIGASDSCGAWLHDVLRLPFSRPVFLLILVAVLITFFQLLNSFMTGAYYNLINDVVPREVLSRFMAVFRIVGIIATSLFQFYFFGLAGSHMTKLIVGSGLLYGLIFLAMTYLVKEGEYPPPEREDAAGGVWLNHAKTYLRECFSYRVYWYYFLANMFWNISFVLYSFRVFFAQSVGLNLDTFGKLMGVAGIFSAMLLYPAGALGDRWHPVRTMVLGMLLLLVVVPLQLVFAFFQVPAAWTPGLYMVLFALHISVQVIVRAAEMPLQMRILPQDRYAQLGSAGGLIMGFGSMIAGGLSGLWLEWMKAGETVELFHYRYLPIWQTFCMIVSLIFLILLLREWKRLGGDRNYIAP